MGNRQALLIGIERYGVGFPALPAVHRDVDQMRTALEALGYEITPSPPDLTNASSLDASIREFCASGGPDDVRLIYFTGHGLLADGVDWIVPEAAARRNAVASPNQRVSTDLSRTVAESGTGLVLFVIDACRNEEDAPKVKGTEGWGDPKRLARPGETRFVRFFGCTGGEVCQVLPVSDGEPTASLFTRALAESLGAGDAVTLEDLLPRVGARCDALLARHPLLHPQAPRLSYGELSATKGQILKRPLFDPVGRAALPNVWPVFDPSKLQCLVVISEFEHTQPPEWGVREMVRDALAGETGDRIWTSFRTACEGRILVTGRERTLAETLDPTAVAFGSFSVLETLSGEQALETAIRAIVEADLVIFDVTDFEPGVMLLVGIRSACCRSLSVCSHGAGWREGQPLETPFNLHDLSVNSHTPRDTRVGPDPVVERFVQRVETGFGQLARHPQYLDLPGYDELRQVGPDYAASATIDVRDRVLILCSFEDSFFRNWQFIASGLKQALWQHHRATPKIERIIDYPTPQLIRQSLYEQIRRAAGCVVDWSNFSASVFLELGARLAVSEFGAVHIADKRYLPDGEKASPLAQVALLQRRFEPLVYRYQDKTSSPFATIANLLMTRSPHLDTGASYNRVHRGVLQVIDTVEASTSPVFTELKERADALHHPQQGRVGAPQVLFYGSRNVKQDSERAALERRIAAWLYLEHRLDAAREGAPAHLRERHRELARSAINALYDLGDDASIDFAAYIEVTVPLELKSVRDCQEQATYARKKGDALRKLDRPAAAQAAYQAGVEALTDALSLLSETRSALTAAKPPLQPADQAALNELVETSRGSWRVEAKTRVVGRSSRQLFIWGAVRTALPAEEHIQPA